MEREYAWKGNQEKEVTDFLSNKRTTFPFFDNDMDFKIPAAKKLNRKDHIKYGIQASRNYLKQIRNLNIVFGELLEEKDTRLQDPSQWLPLNKNILLDLAIPSSQYRAGCSPVIQEKINDIYLRDYKDQDEPYIKDNGTPIEVT